MAGTRVQKFSRKQLDVVKWDAAVAASPTPLPYGLSWWLDTVTDGNWEGLVLDDYRAVFPVPKLTRLAILPAAVRPPYTQQLGPFGKLMAGDAEAILRAVPRTFQTALTLGPFIEIAQVPARFATRRRINYVIDLSGPFSATVQAFPRNLQNYLRRMNDDRIEPMDSTSFATLYRERLGDRKGIKLAHLQYLQRLIDQASKRGLGGCYQLEEEGELLAAGFFPTLHGRTINIAPVSTARGLKRRGMSRLLAVVMRQNSGVPGAVFDFEGSELPGVREYFAKFGSVDEGYLLIEDKLFGLLR